MDAMEFGAYMSLLICCYETNNRLPTDDNRLKYMAKCRGRQWGRIKDTVMQKFIHNGDHYSHPVVAKKLSFVTSSAAELSAKGKKNNDSLPRARKTNIHKDINPILPNLDSPPAQGDFKKNWIGILPAIDQASLDRAKKNAPGWDVYHLATLYDEGIAKGREIPTNPKAAFPAWVFAFTKGKPPE